MSKEVKWLKLMNDIFEDEKIEYIESLPDGEMILLIWIKILCLASKSNENGNLMITSEIPYTSALMAHKFKKSNTQIEYALKVMQQLGMLEINDDIICVSNWCKYQNNDELAKIREKTRLRVAKHRENKKLSSCNDTVTLHCNENALISNISNLESNIFDYWNNRKIMVHRELTDEMKKAINKVIKKYNEDEIKKYIDRYAEVFHDETYWWHYKWSITEFLTRKDAISSFADEGTKWENYCEWKSRKGVNGSEFRGSNTGDNQGEISERIGYYV